MHRALLNKLKATDAPPGHLDTRTAVLRHQRSKTDRVSPRELLTHACAIYCIAPHMLVGWKFEWGNFLSLQPRFDHIERRHWVSMYALNRDVVVAPAIAAIALSARERCTSLPLSRWDMRSEMEKSGEVTNYPAILSSARRSARRRPLPSSQRAFFSDGGASRGRSHSLRYRVVGREAPLPSGTSCAR